ncbi:gamma-glutamyl-gamma-aminobutyrate hydrolase family protein [Sporosarcina obsidiansis]|uniref:gamma-glutamyl-gamma-aminobutyrate hydrolase family protein n=1 Tax=Sporosarcina obsidiansis TaxID=2660748 RepID=UPI00129B13C8|nr:gamma-glutamyl-gamma-aminobutyrate hydrolase family protein [Sporosarcina obsidiansis]
MRNTLIKVGVTGYFVSSEENKDGWIKGVPGQQFTMFSYDFVESILNSKALPALMPIVPKKFIKEQLESIDALILAGGEDIHPRYYETEQEDQQYQDISVERDEYEIELLKQALDMEIPILLVCRGMQLLNIVQNGTLHKDIKTELSTKIDHLTLTNQSQPVHDVDLKKEHFVSSLLGNTVKVNSIHHQSIKHLGGNLEIVGCAKDGIVEVITFQDREDIMAVQWHPEMMYQESEHAKLIFNWLIDKATTNKTIMGD